MRFGLLLCASTLATTLTAQERPVLQNREGQPAVSRQLDDGTYILAAGTRIPLTLMNSISSKNSAPGDQVYLQTMIPVAVAGSVVIPPGTYVMGTVTESVRPGKVKGKGELALRFDRMMFTSGQELDLTGRLGALDGDNPGTLDRTEGKVTSDGSQGRDASKLAIGGAGGAAMGHWIGGQGRDAAIGAGAGAAAGLATVLLTRGPEATLRRGSTIEMVLNGDLRLPAGSGSGSGAPMFPRPRQERGGRVR